jgi:predicted Fe-Mo cluster-binding NifX family protein
MTHDSAKKLTVALATWQDRIAPVFDVAVELTVATIQDAQVIHRQQHPVPAGPPVERARAVVNYGATVLVCGAISRPVQAMLADEGIEVIGFVTGEIDRVIAAWLEGELPGRAFAMPGCGPRRYRFGRGGRGHGGRAKARGRGDRAMNADEMTQPGFGPVGQCLCPQCGYRETHRPGTPCSEIVCPKCGAHMTRERENNYL